MEDEWSPSGCGQTFDRGEVQQVANKEELEAISLGKWEVLAYRVQSDTCTQEILEVRSLGMQVVKDWVTCIVSAG